LPALGAFIDPFDLLDGTGVPSADVSGFYQALEFAPQAVPAPVIGHGLPSVLAIGGVLFGAKLFQCGKKRRSLGTAIRHAAA